jgi:transposase-like protein
MGSPGPEKINRYGIDFKLRAVQTSNQPGVLIKDVAESLRIHPFMLSKWRQQVRVCSAGRALVPPRTAPDPSIERRLARRFAPVKPPLTSNVRRHEKSSTSADRQERESRRGRLACAGGGSLR